MKIIWKRTALSLLIGVVIIFIFQISSQYLNDYLFSTEIQLLRFGTKTFVFALLFTILDVLSGIIIACFMSPCIQNENRSNPWLKILFGFIPMLAISYRLLFSLFYPSLRLIPGMEYVFIADWAIYSSAPGLWLGFVIGCFFKK